MGEYMFAHSKRHCFKGILLTHCGLATSYVANILANIGASDGMVPNRLQVITWTYVVSLTIAPTPYMALPLFATRFAAYAGGTRVSFIQPRLF